MAKKKPHHYEPLANFAQMVDRNAKGLGDKIVFKYFDKNGEVAALTYGGFRQKVDSLAAAFEKMGLGGKRIAVIGETSPEWVVTYFAAVIGGGVIIPLDKELLVDEIANFLNVSEADAIVFSGSFNNKFENIRKNAHTVKFFIPMDPDGEEFPASDNIVSLDALLDTKASPRDRSEDTTPAEREKMSVMLFTSGTTGTSKCVMLSENNIVSCVNAACAAVDFSRNDVVLSVLPIHHTYELSCCIAEMNYGMTICINDHLKHVVKNLKFFQPTALVLVPIFVNTIHKKIWDEAKKKGRDKTLRRAIAATSMIRKTGIDLRRKIFSEVLEAFGGNLRKIICGGAPMNPDMMKNFDNFGITLCEGYGITECSPIIAVNPYYKRKRASVGPAVERCETKIDGLQIGDSGFITGEILVKGENVMLGYYNNPEANAAAFTEDGWYKTGDIGYMDDEKYIFITGRQKSVIVLNNGKNVFPEEMEEYLGGIPEISECVVVGRTNEETGDVVLTALIYPNFDLFPDREDMAGIAESLKSKVLEINKTLPTFKQMRNIEIRKTEFEKTTTRKIKRFKVE